ncbi:conserved Plasmodium protein, unknown function [Plasmodium vivax]|uniref:B box-type domain-containing protein n=1 Tax=Plasmodium vivax TaxID=5855 RepID=A0A1G4HCA4_PLAVI|nr:conserved Plasmodium protein, unknown function [Plasmodium vivax]
MNDKIVIREPLFAAPNEGKSGAGQYEQENFFGGERKDGANLTHHIGTNGPYKRCERWEHDGGSEQRSDPPLQLNEREDMSCFVNYKGDTQNLSHEKNVFVSFRKGEINPTYNIMDNIHDVHYTRRGTNGLNDYLRHVKINHTAPCVGEFRTCMHCFLSIATLFCKTCNVFLCAVCSIKLHKNEKDHVVNVASSGLFENDCYYNDVIVREKDKWLVEMDNNIPVKIREKCPVHTNEYVKYACKSCQYTLLCSDCLLNDPVHVQNEVVGGGNSPGEKRQDGAHAQEGSPRSDQEGENDGGGSAAPLRGGDPPSQTIVSIHQKGDTAVPPTTTRITTPPTPADDLLAHLKPGFKLIRGGHEIYTLVDAKNEIKRELNDKLEVLCRKSLVLKNAIPSLRNTYKYGKITSKNVKRSIRASFTITNSYLEKRKKKLHEELKVVQDKSTNFLKTIDEQRINYHSYLGMKKNEIQHMVKLSGRNAGLSLDYYVQKLESYKCLFFSKGNLIDIEKKLEIPHSNMKSEHLPSLVETMRVDVLEAKKKVSDASALIKKEFEKLFRCSSEIAVYPAHFRHILQKRIYAGGRVEPVDVDARRRQRYFHILPFTDLYMNMQVTFQQQFLRKDSLHQKWEVRTVSLRSVYLCVHTHAGEVMSDVMSGVANGVGSGGGPHGAFPAQLPLSEDPPQSSHFIQKSEIKNLSNDIESVVSLPNVSVKLFSHEDITNITILERRNHPYGIEITEYNEKRDLCGYWLLTAKKESDVNALFDLLMGVKKQNKTGAVVPSFHPKINMSNPMFHFHQKNVNEVYKQLAGGLVEGPVVLLPGENTHMGEANENRLRGDELGRQQGSLETGQSSHSGDYTYERFRRDSSLLHYYEGMDDPEYSQHVKSHKIEDFIVGQTDVSPSNEEMALAECSQDVCAEWSSAESINPFSPCRAALGRAPRRKSPQRDPPQRRHQTNRLPEGHTQGGAGAARLHPLGVHPKKGLKTPPDVNISTVRLNLVHEEQHFMPMNVGSNFSLGEYTAGMYSNGVHITRGATAGGAVHTGSYSNRGGDGGNALGGGSLTGGTLVSGQPDEEGTSVGEPTNEHSGERRSGDHSDGVFAVTTGGKCGDKLGVKNGLMLGSLPVEDPPKMEGGEDAPEGNGKGEPHTGEAVGVARQVPHSTATSVAKRETCRKLAAIVQPLEGGRPTRLIHRAEEEPTGGKTTGGATNGSDLEETLAKTGELLNSDEVTKFLRRLNLAQSTSGGSLSSCRVKRLPGERQSPTVERGVAGALRCPDGGATHVCVADRGEGSNTPGHRKRGESSVESAEEPPLEPAEERPCRVYPEEGPLPDDMPMNGTAPSPRDRRNNQMQLLAPVRRENLAGGNPPYGGHKEEGITRHGEREGDALTTIVGDHSSVRASTGVMMLPLSQLDKSERGCFPVGGMNAKVPFRCGSPPREDTHKVSRICNVLSDHRGGSDRGGLNEPGWTSPGVALTSGGDNGEAHSNRVQTDEQIGMGTTHPQGHRKNGVRCSPMEDVPREENRKEVSPTRGGDHAATPNLRVIMKPSSVHLPGRARLVKGTENSQGRMRSGVGRFRLEKEERHKTPPPKRKKNQGGAGSSAVPAPMPMARLKQLDGELAPGGDLPASVISRVLSQIGSKKVGS